VLNLSAIRDFHAVVVRHYCESLFLAANLPSGQLSVVDVGSGAGFPGIPVAVLRPDCRVCLVESHKRKAVFLGEATRHFPNVQVAAKRAEDLEDRFDWLVSRAVSWRDLQAVARRVASHVTLLLAAADAQNLLKENGLFRKEPIPLPWAKQKVLLLGDVSRGT
jgi:16S rRNA (guanine527-N7)-methyltransferase